MDIAMLLAAQQYQRPMTKLVIQYMTLVDLLLPYRRLYVAAVK